MSILINNISINQYSNELNINVETAVGYNITSLTLKYQTGLDNLIDVDLTNKLSNISNVENITLIPTDLNLTSFEGIFLFEIKSNEEYLSLDNNTILNKKHGLAVNISDLHYYITKSIITGNYGKYLEELNMILHNIYAASKIYSYSDVFKLYNIFYKLIQKCKLFKIINYPRVSSGVFTSNNIIKYN